MPLKRPHSTRRRLLTPSHGYPLRLVAPGIIGGRCVKWLTTVRVAVEDTSNYYHVSV